jgi:inner membrane protein
MARQEKTWFGLQCNHSLWLNCVRIQIEARLRLVPKFCLTCVPQRTLRYCRLEYHVKHYRDYYFQEIQSMRTSIHRFTGTALGLWMGLYLQSKTGHTGWAASVALGAYLGSTAPDYLEMPSWSQGVRSSIIPHRTITHWVAGWIALLGWTWWNMQHQSAALPLVGVYAVFGFASSALLHCLMDGLTPMGVPWILPFRGWR